MSTDNEPMTRHRLPLPRGGAVLRLLGGTAILVGLCLLPAGLDRLAALPGFAAALLGF